MDDPGIQKDGAGAGVGAQNLKYSDLNKRQKQLILARRDLVENYGTKRKLSTLDDYKEYYSLVFGFFQGLLNSNLPSYSSDSKQINSILSQLYDKLHGTDDTYDNLNNVVIKENFTPLIQQVFDLTKKQMGRMDDDDVFTVDIPTAVVFCHELLTNETPDMTFTNYSEDDARGIVDRHETETAGRFTVQEMEENSKMVEQSEIMKPRKKKSSRITGGKKHKSRRRHKSKHRRHKTRRVRRHKSKRRRH